MSIVERLRVEVDPDVNEPLDRLLEEAADEIERQKAKNSQLYKKISEMATEAYDLTVRFEDERERCIAICGSWIGSFQNVDIQHLSARQWAVNSIEDIMELIRNGHDPRKDQP